MKIVLEHHTEVVVGCGVVLRYRESIFSYFAFVCNKEELFSSKLGGTAEEMPFVLNWDEGLYLCI